MLFRTAQTLSNRFQKKIEGNISRSTTLMGKSSTFPSFAHFSLLCNRLNDAGVGSLSRTKSQQATSLSAAHKLVNFSSFRIAKPSPSPLRRNTTRGARGTSQNTVHTSDNSLRQLSVDPTLLHSAPDTRNTSPNLSEGNLRSVSMNFSNTTSEHGR